MKIRWAESTKREPDGWRLWPEAFYIDGQPAAYVACGTSYHSALLPLKIHSALTLYVGDYRHDGFSWRRVGRPFESMADVKAALVELLQRHPEFLPKSLAE